MTTITVTLNDDKDLPELQEILKRFDLDYKIDKNDFQFTQGEIIGFLKTKEDFLNGRTTARTWEEIENDLGIL